MIWWDSQATGQASGKAKHTENERGLSDCGVREGMEICVKDTWISTTNQDYCQVHITNRKRLLLSSSQFSEQSKPFGAVVWHTSLPGPSQPWGSNPQAEEFPASQVRKCLVWEHCTPVKVELQGSSEHRRHLWGETREGEEDSFWGFMTIALCGRAGHLHPELYCIFIRQ